MNRNAFFATCIVAFSLTPACANESAESTVEFNRDIRPILSDNCFYCHGFDEAHREAGLRLDTFEGATEFDTVIPGDPDESELVRRIFSEDPDEVMPPPDSEKTLTAEERELIQRWIRQGAQYQEHWAWKPLHRPDVPKGSFDVSEGSTGGPSQTATHPVDAFLQRAWDTAGIKPTAAAPPRDLLRRLSFDLRGLPPSIEDVEDLQADPSEENFLRFRDRWMNELPYAEHQAVRWLDLVRWADTSGFVSDEPIDSGAYRRWVIESFRDNMPFDQFSTAQLAGDLLPNPSDDDLIASGYNRIVNTNCEAGAIEAEQLYKLKGEHVRALGTVWMGLTTGCAECHDHKFDPILAKDYYSLAAFFDDLVEAGVYTPGDRREPLHYVYDAPTKSQSDKDLQGAIASLKNRIAASDASDMARWESEIRSQLGNSSERQDFVWVPAALPAVRVLEGGFDLTELDDQTVRETHAADGELQRHHAAEFMTGYFKVNSVKTDSAEDAWYVDVWIDEQDRPDMLGIQISHGDYGRLGWRTANYETYYWGEDSSGTLDQEQPWNDPDRVKRIGDLPKESGWVRLQVPLKDRISPVAGQDFAAVGMAWLHTGGHVRWGSSGLNLRTDKKTMLVLGETAMRKWWDAPYNRQVYERRFEYVAKAVKKDASKRDQLQNEVAFAAFREASRPDLMTELRRHESRLGRLRSQALPVLVSKRSDSRKSTRLLNRGDYLDETGPIVSPAVPEFFNNPIDSDLPTRLDLANWLFDDENPLTARVYVNRLWHQFFGRGLSDTLDDSGTQGEWPSNHELLDWLACEFRDSGWDRDHMVRLLTSSRAYRLSSKPTETQLQNDPNNRLHARGSRFRLPAETIRDTALQAAGLLTLTNEIPTRSVFPYQPPPYWTTSDKVMFGSRHLAWNTSREQTQYARSMYTFWKRQNIHPTMLAFDAPTRQECTAKRNITNTPGQALALLNDPIFVEAARVFASRIMQNAESDSDRLDHAFAVALQRPIRDDERVVLLQLLSAQVDVFTESPDDANALISIGQSPVPADVSPIELAAWSVVTRVILNLHEFLNRA